MFFPLLFHFGFYRDYGSILWLKLKRKKKPTKKKVVISGALMSPNML